MKRVGVPLLGMWILLHGSAARSAPVAIDFVTSQSITAFGDFNISAPAGDPAVIQSLPVSVDIATSGAPDGLTLSVTHNTDQLSTGLVVGPDGSAASPTQYISFPGSWPDLGTTLSDAIVVMQGNAMSLGIIGQDASNSADTGFLFSSWQRTPTAVTRDDFLGTWATGTSYGSSNLIAEGFSQETNPVSTFTVTPGPTSDTITVAASGESVDLQVDGSRAFLPSPTQKFGANQLALELQLGGDGGLIVTTVGQELSNASDLSLSFTTASPVPVPAALPLLASALAGLLGLRRYTRAPGGVRRSVPPAC